MCMLSIANGRPLVLAGPSGSGKSTLLKRLFVEFQGEVGFSVSRENLFLYILLGLIHDDATTMIDSHGCS